VDEINIEFLEEIINISFEESTIEVSFVDESPIDIVFQEDNFVISFEETSEIILQFTDVGPQGPPGPGDKNYEQTFLTESSVLVTHNLNKRPSVTVIDSADTEIICQVIYIDNDTLSVVFSSPVSGVVICN